MKIFGINITRWQSLLLVGDIVLILTAIVVAFLTRTGQAAELGVFEHIFRKFTGATAFILCVHLPMFYVFELYDLRTDYRSFKGLARLVLSVVAATAALTVAYYLFPNWRFGRGTILYHSVFILAGLLAWRLLVQAVMPALKQVRPGAIVGVGELARATLDELGTQWPSEEMSIVALFDHRSDLVGTRIQGMTVRSTDGLSAGLEELGIRAVVMGDDQGWDDATLREALQSKILGVAVYELVALYKKITGKVPVEHVRQRYFLFGPGFQGGRGSFAANFWRLFDISMALLVLVVTSPILLISALLVLVLNGRPVLFVQQRTGRDEKPFLLYKLRTMVRNAEEQTGAVWATSGDPRVTRLGRFLRRTRIDEIPQCLNILKGDMSIIGPRPERPEFVAMLKKRVPYYALRFVVRPGLTGWAQVNFRYGNTESDSLEKLQYDLYYIQETSLLLEVIILLKTVQTVLLKPGS